MQSLDYDKSFLCFLQHIKMLEMVGMGKSIVRSSGSQLFTVCGPLSKTLNTCCLLLINRALRYHGRVFSKGPGNRSVASKGNRGLRFRNSGLRHQLKCLQKLCTIALTFEQEELLLFF